MIVWIASYPRSGNTFLRVILNNSFNIKTYSLYDDDVDIGSDDKTSDVVGHQYLPDGFDLEEARNSQDAWYIKTHELPDSRISTDDKIIYLVRDGRESTRSFVRYIGKYSDKKKSLPDVIHGNAFSGTWGEHVDAWSRLEGENCIVIRFEDLIAEPETYINRLSEFLELSILSTDTPTFNDLKGINSRFFSTGKTNTWEDYFTGEQNVLFWLKNYPQMMKYGYTNGMPEAFSSPQNIELFRAISDENRYQIDLQLNIKHELEVVNNRLRNEIQQLRNKLQSTNNELNAKQKELQMVYGSKRWVYTGRLLRLFGKG